MTKNSGDESPPPAGSTPESASAPAQTLNLVTEEPEAATDPLATPQQALGRQEGLEDWTRLALAAGLLVLLAVLVLGTGSFVLVYPKKEPAVEAFLKLVFTPIVGLVGSVVGFYFGSRLPNKGS